MEENDEIIERLKEEIISLKQCETLEYTRRQHDQIISSCKEKHSKELFDLQKKLDEAKEELLLEVRKSQKKSFSSSL